MSSPTSLHASCAPPWRPRRPRLRCAACGRNAGKRRRGFRHQAPDALHEAMRAFDAGLGPDHVALRRRIRQHEPARRVGAVAGDDVVGVDDVLLRLRHLLDRRRSRPACRRRAARRVRLPSTSSTLTSAGVTQPSRALVGLVHDHALREQALERLFDRVQMAGRLHGAGEEARIEQVQDRVLDAADILVDRQPAVLAVDRRTASSAAVSFHGSVKRAKYQDESTNVSIVSVSRRAGLPHCGQSTCFQVG